jgi:hypothetical protein
MSHSKYRQPSISSSIDPTYWKQPADSAEVANAVMSTFYDPVEAMRASLAGVVPDSTAKSTVPSERRSAAWVEIALLCELAVRDHPNDPDAVRARVEKELRSRCPTANVDGSSGLTVQPPLTFAGGGVPRRLPEMSFESMFGSLASVFASVYSTCIMTRADELASLARAVEKDPTTKIKFCQRCRVLFATNAVTGGVYCPGIQGAGVTSVRGITNRIQGCTEPIDAE